MGENTFQIFKDSYDKIQSLNEIELSAHLHELVKQIKELTEGEFRALFDILFDKYWDHYVNRSYLDTFAKYIITLFYENLTPSPPPV